MKVKELMTVNAAWVDAETPLAKVAETLRDNDIGCLPVGDNDRLVGMITDRDIACRAVAEGRDPNKTTAREVMSPGIVYCFEDQSDAEALQMMESKAIHHLPVLSRQKRIVGMLSLSDFALKGDRTLKAEIPHLASRDAARHRERLH